MNAAVAKDKRVDIAIHHWAPRFVSSGVPLADFEEVTASVTHWDQRCAAWSSRAAVHEAFGRQALAEGYRYSAGQHLTRAAIWLIVKGGNHVANNRRYMFQTQTADWLGRRLGAPNR